MRDANSKMNNLYKWHWHLYLPPFVSSSNGIVWIWNLARKLRDKGIGPVYISLIQDYPGSSNHPRIFDEYIVPTSFDDGLQKIGLYPDFVEGNPLNAVKVIRIVGASTLCLQGRFMMYSPSDYLVSASPAANSFLNDIYFPTEDVEDLKQYRVSKKKDLVVIYYGKLRIWPPDRRLDKLLRQFNRRVVITREWPSDKFQLRSLISEAMLLVSMDALTNISFESLLLGTPVYMADPAYEGNYRALNLKGLYFSLEEIPDLDTLRQLDERLVKNVESSLYTYSNGFPQKFDKFISDVLTGPPVGVSGLRAYFKSELQFYEKEWRRSPLLVVSSQTKILLFVLLRHRFLAYLLTPLLLIKFVPSFLLPGRLSLLKSRIPNDEIIYAAFRKSKKIRELDIF